jgi:hypothetical protein
MPWKSKKPFKCNTANSRSGKDFITEHDQASVEKPGKWRTHCKGIYYCTNL